jgi:putative ABC transport system permease protein
MIRRWWQVAIRNWRARFTRTLLESIAVVVACALVVTLTGAFAAAELAFRAMHERWMGRVDAQITSTTGRSFPQSMVGKLAATPDVAEAAGRLVDRAQLVAPNGKKMSVRVYGKEIPEDGDLHPTSYAAGHGLRDPAGREVVVEETTASELGLSVGQTVQLRVYDESWDFRIVGVEKRPAMFAFINQSVSMPLTAAQDILDRRDQVDVAFARFAPGADAEKVADSIHRSLGGEFQIERGADRQSLLQENLPLWRANLFMLCSLLLAIAMFLIFATLACDVMLRVAEMGTLRCLGASRRQLAGLVLLESLPMAGWGAILGVPLGLAGSWIVVRSWPGIFTEGWVLSPWGVVLAVVGSTVATLGGALLPAIAATRVSPIQARRMYGRAPRRHAWMVCAPAAAVLLAVPSLMLWLENEGRRAVFGHIFIGLPMMAIGMFLLAVVVLPWVAGPIGRLVGVALRVHPDLAGRYVVSARWRSAAVATALGLCVALVVSANTETESVLAGTALPTQIPDLIIVLPDGVFAEQAKTTFAQIGVKDWVGLNGFDIQVLNLPALSHPNIIQAMMSWRGGNTWYLALDADRMNNLKALNFLQGNAAEAAKRLTEGDAVVITGPFAGARGVNMGDKLTAVDWQGKPVELEIVGVVNSLSTEVTGAAYGLSDLYTQNVALTMLGSSGTAYNRFNQRNYSILLVQTDSVAQSDLIAQELREQWRGMRMEDLSLRRLKGQIESEFRKLTLVFSLIGGVLGAAVALVGVANAMQAGVYGRRRELGVLHAVGMTRGQLNRLILGEAIVLGVAGSALGVLVGLYASRMGLRIYELMTGRVPGPLTVPYQAVGWVVILALAGTVLASVAAAFRAGRASALDLMSE